MVQISIGQTVLGGLLIAAASSLLLYSYGRLIGESGFIARNLRKDGGWINWQLTFLIGMILAPNLLHWIFNGSITINGSPVYFFNTALSSSNNVIGWLIGGLLVGIGARMGCGCTSGHIITGLPRLTKRSIFATVIILGFGFLMSNLKNHLGFLTNESESLTFSSDTEAIISYVIFAIIIVSYIFGFVCEFASISLAEHIFMFLCGFIFGAGLLISGLCNNAKVMEFLTFSSSWDLTIGVVFAVAVVTNFLLFLIISKAGARNGMIEDPPSGVHTSLMIGCALFGLGWGFCGISPGSALILVIAQPNSVYFFVFMILGMILYDKNIFSLRKGGALEESLL